MLRQVAIAAGVGARRSQPLPRLVRCLAAEAGSSSGGTQEAAMEALLKAELKATNNDLKLVVAAVLVPPLLSERSHRCCHVDSAAEQVKVDDISGGCGSMYSISVESPLFKGLTLVKQHKMVKVALKKEIAAMHGLTLQTRISPAA